MVEVNPHEEFIVYSEVDKGEVNIVHYMLGENRMIEIPKKRDNHWKTVFDQLKNRNQKEDFPNMNRPEFCSSPKGPLGENSSINNSNNHRLENNLFQKKDCKQLEPRKGHPALINQQEEFTKSSRDQRVQKRQIDLAQASDMEDKIPKKRNLKKSREAGNFDGIINNFLASNIPLKQRKKQQIAEAGINSIYKNREESSKKEGFSPQNNFIQEKDEKVWNLLEKAKKNSKRMRLRYF